MIEDAAKTKLMIATLQKYGYDLEIVGEGSDGEGYDENAPRMSSVTSAGILQLRERKNHQTALHIAVKKGHMDVLKALAKLPRVSDAINLGDRHANTALHFAASSTKDNAAEMVEFLFSLGASLNAVNVRGQTPLMIHIMTVKDDVPAITRLFVKKGILLNELINGTTYLHMAVERNLIEIAGALIAGGASINIPDTNGEMVSDTIAKKTLVKLICFMKEGTQSGPLTVVRTSCKICKNPKGLLETFKDCNLCGRVVCKNCSKKASEIKSAMVHPDGVHHHTAAKDKDAGRLCNVCTTVVLLRDKQHRAKEGFNNKLMGCGMK